MHLLQLSAICKMSSANEELMARRVLFSTSHLIQYMDCHDKSAIRSFVSVQGLLHYVLTLLPYHITARFTYKVFFSNLLLQNKLTSWLNLVKGLFDWAFGNVSAQFFMLLNHGFLCSFQPLWCTVDVDLGRFYCFTS